MPVEPTPEEQARIDRLRELNADLPEGVEVEFVTLEADEIPAAIAEQDGAMFVKPIAYSFTVPSDELPGMACFELDGPEWLADAVVAKTVTCAAYGIGNQIEGVDVPLFAHLQLSVDGHYTPLFVTIDDAPENIREAALDRFCIAFPERSEGFRPWLATGPLVRLAKPVVVLPKTGRNSPCPCGSGRKFKRCCAA